MKKFLTSKFMLCLYFVVMAGIAIFGMWAGLMAQEARAEEEVHRSMCLVSVCSLAEYQRRILPYADYIMDTLKAEGLPESLIWLAIVESGARPDAVSNKGAVGLWQLMKPTAEHYGCKDRLNVECSTAAAVKYLKRLYVKFNGNLEDVVIAYNMGGSNYIKAGKPTEAAKNLSYVVNCLMQLTPALKKTEVWIYTAKEDECW